MSDLPADPELRALFVEEMRRHAAACTRPDADATGRIRTLHAMRGAAAMMGLSELAARLHEIETETRAGDSDAAIRAIPQIDGLLRAEGYEIPELAATAARISSQPPERISSPGAPRSSDRPSLDPEVLAYFFAEARTRVERFGECLNAIARGGATDALDEAFRNVHAIKGAASTVGLGSIARGAHALEAALLALKSRAGDLSTAEVEVLSAARSHLALALDSPPQAAGEAQALVTILRDAGLIRDRDLHPVSSLPRDRARDSPDLDVLRVPAPALAGVAESVAEVGALGDRMLANATSIRDTARAMQQASRSVQEALTRIGPPRPWGAPADALDRLQSVVRALDTGAAELDREGERIGLDAEAVGTLAGGARDALQRVGATSARWLFERVAAAAEALARRERKEVLIVRQGESVELSRSTAERLVEPISQLARNAVTHGVEPPSSRLARKKPARATLRLSAAIEVGRLRLTVEDDGGGVDIEGIGHRAVALGVLNDALRSDPAAVLATLFLPGVSTRVKADTSAGRGFGLDLVHREIAQLGGEIAVDSKRGLFTRFTIEIPLRPIAQQMLVVISAGERMAIPLDRITRVVPSPRDAGGARVFALANATGVSMLPAASASDGGAVVLVATARGPLGIGVDGVERARDFVVRPLPPLLAGMRPWSSAVLDAEGHVILVLDVDALAG